MQDELVNVQPGFKTELLTSVEVFHVDVESFEERYSTVSIHKSKCPMLGPGT